MDLEKYKVQKAPPTVYYIPNFISAAEEGILIKQVLSAPKPKWTQLSNRRLQNWGGIPHPKGMIAEKIPEWLTINMKRIGEMNVFGEGKMPNHVLVNEYLPGQGIMPHTDGPLFYPTITTITCGSHGVLNFCQENTNTVNEINDGIKTRENMFSLLLERRSLVIFQEDVYNNFLHSIDEVLYDTVEDGMLNIRQCGEQYTTGQKLHRAMRISLTIRRVPHTTKLLVRLSK